MLTDVQKQELMNHTLLGRTGTVFDVVTAVLSILNSPFMTGSIIRLDGGYVLGGEKTGPMPAGVL